MKIICISGKAQHGKDTTADVLKETLEAQNKSVLVAHYGDLLKYICRSFFGWDGEKDEYGRTLLQRVGTDVIRKQQEDYWVRFISDILKFFPDEWDYVLIPDSRFPNEIDYLKDAGLDVIHVRVRRDGFISPLTEEQQKHPSETALDFVEPDYILLNDGTLRDLKKQIYDMIRTWKKTGITV